MVQVEYAETEDVGGCFAAAADGVLGAGTQQEGEVQVMASLKLHCGMRKRFVMSSACRAIANELRQTLEGEVLSDAATIDLRGRLDSKAR